MDSLNINKYYEVPLPTQARPKTLQTDRLLHTASTDVVDQGLKENDKTSTPAIVWGEATGSYINVTT
jgi:hypothetical protein